MQKQFRGSSCLNIDDKKINLDYYMLSELRMNCEEDEPRVTYGIEIVENDCESECISDVTVDENKAIFLIDILKDNNVFPAHLRDVVENML